MTIRPWHLWRICNLDVFANVLILMHDITIVLINTLWDSWEHMILVDPTTVHHLKTDHVENKHPFYPEPSPQSFWSSWVRAALAEIKGFIPTSLCTKQMYWLNNLSTAVHKASGLETARLGFTERVYICLTNTHKLNSSKNWKFTGRPIPRQQNSGLVFLLMCEKSELFIQVCVILVCAWFCEK